MPESDSEPLSIEDLIEWMNIANKRIIIAPADPGGSEPASTDFAWWVREGNNGANLASGRETSIDRAFDAGYGALRGIAATDEQRYALQMVRARREARGSSAIPTPWTNDGYPTLPRVPESQDATRLIQGALQNQINYYSYMSPQQYRSNGPVGAAVGASVHGSLLDRLYPTSRQMEQLASWERELLDGGS